MAELADPGYFDPVTLVEPPDAHDPDTGGWLAFEADPPTPRSIAASTNGETSITVGGSTLSLIQCLNATGALCARRLWPTTTSVDSSTDVFSGPSSSFNEVVQRNQSEVRRLVVIEEESAPTNYRFVLSGGSFSAEADGGITFRDRSGLALGEVAKSWALDANGVAVPTSYTVDSYGSLVLSVAHVGAAHPVVADPKLSVGWGVYLAMWGWEIRHYGAAIYAAGAAAYLTSCVAANEIPHRVVRFLAVLLCGAVGASTVRETFDKIKAIYRSGAVQDYTCYQAKITSYTDSFKVVSSSECV